MDGFFSTLQRRIKHWRVGAGHGRTLFPQDALDAFSHAITQGEQTHRGEVRLIVETGLPGHAIWAGHTVRERALALFAEHGIWDTEDNCGVLLYVNLAEHKVEIVADRAINRVVPPEGWQAICRELTSGFAGGRYRDSTLAAIEAIHALLRQHFPATGPRANGNELPDAPLML